MARQDAKLGVRQNPPQRRLQYLLNETYMKIDELKELLRKEAALTGMTIADASVGRMFSRQDYLVTLCAEACIEQERRQAAAVAASHHHHHHHHHSSSASGRVISETHLGSKSHSSIPEHPRSSKGDRIDEGKPDGSWYGSLDRSLAKKKKHQLIDKRRRHTKTIGSMAGLDVIKKSSELKPDEQYEIGLPAAPKVTSSRSSIFPMTQHQYYTALMESKMTKKPAYPLEVRQVPVQPHYPPTVTVMHRPGATWGYYVENLDENKNMKKHIMEVVQQQQQQPPPPPPAPMHLIKTNLVPLPCRSLGNELTFRHSHSGKSSKKWYETNLDDCAGAATPVVAQNPSPSPSMLSSTRGSSRGSVASGIDTVDGGVARMAISSPANESTEFTSKSSESSESWSGTGNEVTKPFEMSDYFKYSTKFRNRSSPVSEDASQHEPRSPNGMSSAMSSTSIMHSRQSSQVRQGSFDGLNGLRDTNGNPNVGPKLPPKQRRNLNKSMGSSSVIFEGEMDPSKEVWITNEPTFV